VVGECVERGACARKAGSVKTGAGRDTDGRERRIGCARDSGLLTQDFIDRPASRSSESASSRDSNESQSGALRRGRRRRW
jgi:hypothetical protein